MGRETRPTYSIFRRVAASWVDGELCEDFAGAVLDGCDVGVADEQDDALVFVDSSDAEVPEPSCVAERDLAVGVDAVGADPPVFGVCGSEPGAGVRGCRSAGICPAVR
ncbi:MAG: hypothetical protein NVS1B16_00700 [Pseudarthrobacter sp.]